VDGRQYIHRKAATKAPVEGDEGQIGAAQTRLTMALPAASRAALCQDNHCAVAQTGSAW
jgi:hypothetical protein